MFLDDQPEEGAALLIPTPSIARAGMTTFLNTTIPLGELEAGGLVREVDAESHELPMGRGDCTAIGGRTRDENVRVIHGNP